LHLFWSSFGFLGQIKGFALVLKELVFGKSNSFTILVSMSDYPKLIRPIHFIFYHSKNKKQYQQVKTTVLRKTIQFVSISADLQMILILA
jgi:hypothetical protein